MEGKLKNSVTNAAAAEAALKKGQSSSKSSGSQGSRNRHRSNSAGSQKGSSKNKKPTSRSAAVAELMDEYELATVAAVMASMTRSSITPVATSTSPTTTLQWEFSSVNLMRTLLHHS
jgi:hypothetical protein